jgi:hypothetical protein
MGFLERFAAIMRVLRRAKGPIGPLELLKRRPALLVGYNLFEMLLNANGATDIRAKALAGIKTSALIGCPF